MYTRSTDKLQDEVYCVSYGGKRDNRIVII